MEQQRNIQRYEYLLYAISVMLYMTGIVCYLMEYYSMQTAVKWKACGILSLVAVICLFLSYKKENRTHQIAMIPFGCALFLIIVRPYGMVRGFAALVNERIVRWNTYREEGKKVISVQEADLNDICATVLVISLIILGFMIWWKITTKMYAGMCLALVLSIVDLLIGKSNGWIASFFIAGIFGIWFSQIKRGIWFVKIFWNLVMVVTLFSVSLISGKNMEVTKNLREKTKQGVEDTRYRKSMLPEGDLYKADQMENGEGKMLQVQTEQVKSLYLRGFEGGCYEDGKWKELKNSSYGYEHSGMLDWLQTKDFMSAREYGRYQELSDSSEMENHVEITNLGTDREYLYLPYSVLQIEGQQYREEKDNGFRSTSFFGSSKYAFTEASPDLPAELFVADKWIKNPKTEEQKNYMQAESVYRKFVYEEYLEIDKNLQPYISTTFYDSAKAEDMTGIYAIANHIRTILKNQVSYRKVPKAVPEGVDPIYWFMTKGKEGNSALFASTAVMAFRSFGIPARYAEGYLLEKENIEKAGGGKVTLTQKDSHAWVEIYLDGIGWLDIDVTPGYYYEEYALMQMIEEPQGIQLTADLKEKKNKENGQGEGSGQGEELPPERQELNIKTFIITILTIVLIIIVLFLLILEGRRWCYYFYWKRKWHQLKPLEKCQIVYERMINRLHMLHIEAALGWQTAKVEKQIQRYVPTVYDGEYEQINRTLEKGIYGDKELTEWEFQGIYEFMDKLLFDVTWKRGILLYIKYRYF